MRWIERMQSYFWLFCWNPNLPNSLRTDMMMSVHVISQSFCKLIGWNLWFQRKTAKSEPGLSVPKYKMVMFCLYNLGFVENILVAHRKGSSPRCCEIQWSLMPRWALEPAEYRKPQAGQKKHCWAALRSGLGSDRQLPAGTLNSIGEAITAVRPGILASVFHYVKMIYHC